MPDPQQQDWFAQNAPPKNPKMPPGLDPDEGIAVPEEKDSKGRTLAAIPEPIASVRTPAGGSKLYDTQVVGGKTMSITGFDSQGRPQLEFLGLRHAKPGPYLTTLSAPEESAFKDWVKKNNIPFQDEENADYDMRGYFKALRSGDPRAKQAENKHFPDTWKTPYHKTFSRESMYALPTAPRWDGDRLVDTSGNVIADETPAGDWFARNAPVLSEAQRETRANIAQYPERQELPDPEYMRKRAASKAIEALPYEERRMLASTAPKFTPDPEQERRIRAQEEIASGFSNVPQAAAPALSFFQRTVNDPLDRLSRRVGQATGEIMERSVVEPDPYDLYADRSPEAMQKRIEEQRKEFPAIAGGLRATGQVVGGVAGDPRYWPLLFTGEGLFSKVLSIGFTGQMVHGTVQGIKEYKEIKDNPNVPEDQKYEVLTSAIISGLMAAHSGHGLLKSGRVVPGPLEKEVADEIKAMTPEQQAEIFRRVHARLQAKADELFPKPKAAAGKPEMSPIPETGVEAVDRRGSAKTESDQPHILDVPVLDAGERQALRYEQDRKEAYELLERERAQRIVDEQDQSKRIEDEIGEQTRRETAITERRVVAPKGSQERMDTVMQQFRSLGDEMETRAQKAQFENASDMVRSLLEKRPRGKALTPDEKDFMKLWEERKRLVQMVDPHDPVETEFGRQEREKEAGLVTREQELREAAARFDEEASRASSPDESQKKGEAADEAIKRAEEIRTAVDRQRAERAAAREQETNFPEGTPVGLVSRGRETEVRLPDGRKIAARYAIVNAEDLVTSHDPSNFTWNDEYQPRRLQPRDYEKNKEAQAGVIAGGQNFEVNAVHNTDDTGHNGPPVIFRDGRVAGGNGRAMRISRAYKEEGAEAIRDHLKENAEMFGIDPDSVPDADKHPVLVRVLDETPTDLAELINLGQDLNRTETRGFTQAEQSVMSAERISQETMDWVSLALDRLGEDASVRDLMRHRGGELVERLMRDDLFDPTKRAQFVTSDGELTEDAKRLFENALLGKVIDDADLIATMPPFIKTKLARSLAALAKVKAAEPAWDFTDYLQEAIRNWKRIEAVGDTLDAYGKKGDSAADRWFAYQQGKMIPEPPDHPAVEAMTKLLEKPGKDVKEAFTRYAEEIEGKQEGLSFKPPMNPREAFNQHIGEKQGVEIKDGEWGTLRPTSQIPTEKEAQAVQDEDPELASVPDDELQADYDTVKELYGDDDPIVKAYKNELERRHGAPADVPAPLVAEGSLPAPLAPGVTLEQRQGLEHTAERLSNNGAIFYGDFYRVLEQQIGIDKDTFLGWSHLKQAGAIRKFLQTGRPFQDWTQVEIDALGFLAEPKAAEPAPIPVAPEEQAKADVQKAIDTAIRTTGPLTEEKLRDILSQHPNYSAGKVGAAVDVWKRFAEDYLGIPFDQWLQENASAVEIMGPGPTIPNEAEVPTGILFQPLEAGHIQMIKEGGGIPVGIQEGFGEHEAIALFNHPETQSTLGIKMSQLTADAVRARLAKHLEENAEVRRKYGKGVGVLFQREWGAGMQPQELEAWARAAGRKLSIEDHGQQMSLFGAPENVYKLKNSKGESILVTQTQMDALREKVPEIGARVSDEGTRQGGLFGGPQMEPLPGGQGGLFGGMEPVPEPEPAPPLMSAEEEEFRSERGSGSDLAILQETDPERKAMYIRGEAAGLDIAIYNYRRMPLDELQTHIEIMENDQRILEQALAKPKQEPKQERLTPEEFVRQVVPEGVTGFASGANRVADIRGFVNAGVPVGVDVSAIGEDAIQELESLAGKNIPVFLDSGAFGETRFDEDGKPVIDKPIHDKEWTRRLDIYEQLARKLGSSLTVVAPDMVGQQKGTLDRLAKFGQRLRTIREKGARIVVPIQFGDDAVKGNTYQPDEFWFAANDDAGFDIFRKEAGQFIEKEDIVHSKAMVPGFPMNKAAMRPEDVIAFVRFTGVKDIHLLGMGISNAAADPLVRALREMDPEIKVTFDANALRAHTGEGRGVTEAQRAGGTRESAVGETFKGRKIGGQFEMAPLPQQEMQLHEAGSAWVRVRPQLVRELNEYLKTNSDKVQRYKGDPYTLLAPDGTGIAFQKLTSGEWSISTWRDKNEVGYGGSTMPSGKVEATIEKILEDQTGDLFGNKPEKPPGTLFQGHQAFSEIQDRMMKDVIGNAAAKVKLARALRTQLKDSFMAFGEPEGLQIKNPTDNDIRWYAKVVLDNYTTASPQPFDRATVDAVIRAVKPEDLRQYQLERYSDLSQVPGEVTLFQGQEKQTQTPEFKKWFGDSKVVDEQGKPKVVYHGTTSSFDVFDKEKLGQQTKHRTASLGFFFAADPELAGHFTEKTNFNAWPPQLSRETRPGANLVPVYLNIENPFEISAAEWKDIVSKVGTEGGPVFDGEKTAQWLKQHKKEMIRKGHDGIHITGDPKFRAWLGGNEFESDNWVAFEPEQVKSATGNRGTFDSSGNILQQGENRGAVQFMEDGRALIHLMENANISTIFHEFAHIARRNLKPEDRGVVEKWLKVSEGAWHVDHEEKFARSFERYLYDGEAPIPELKPVFARIRDWMMKVYHQVKGSSINIRIPEDVRNVFDRMVAGEKLVKEPKESKTRTKVKEADRSDLPKAIDVEATHIQENKETQGEGLTAEERLNSEQIAAGGENFGDVMADAKLRVFPDAEQAVKWAKSNSDGLKGIKLYQMADGRAFAHFVPKDPEVLFQETDPTELDRRIRLIDERLGKLIPENERMKLGKMRQELTAQKNQKAMPFMPPAPGSKPIMLWTPEGEVEVGGRGETRTEPERAATDVPPPLQKGGRSGEVSEQPGQQRRPGESGATGRGVRGNAPSGGGQRPGREPRKAIPDVPDARVDAPVRPRGEPVYEAADWTSKMKAFDMPTNAPAPTVRIPASLRRMLYFPGQPEVVEMALSGLKQHDAFIIATTQGTGKTYTGAAVLSVLHKPGMKTLVMTVNKDLIHAPDNGWVAVARDFDNDIEDLPPGVGFPDKPGIYITTAQTAIGREGIEKGSWDLVIRDEVGDDRKWTSSQRGAMMKVLTGNAKKVLYMSATPFHTALEIGHMDKLGLWKDTGFETWARQFGVYRDAEGNLAGGNAPKKLLKLREQLIERGQFVNQNTNLEGFNTDFAQVPLTSEQVKTVKNINEAFQLAEAYFKRKGKKAMIRATKGNAVTFIKKYLERARLPQAIELAKKLEAEGWKVGIFSETKTGRTEVFDFLKQADEEMGGRISELLPDLPDVPEELQAQFGDTMANYSGPHSAARSAEKKAFLDNDKQHIYVSYAAGGIGVSLHDYTKGGIRPRAVIYLGPPYSGMMFDQAIRRFWRYGTNSNVHAIFLTSNAAPEINMVVGKIAPRMSSLRAMVSGIEHQDKFVNTLHSLDENREQQAAYEMGQGVNFDSREYEDAIQTHAIQSWKDIKIKPASEAVGKGLKLPDTGVHPGVIRLFQGGDEYEPLDPFNLPEDKEAEMENDRLGREMEEGARIPGDDEGEPIPAPVRTQMVDYFKANAKAAAAATGKEGEKLGDKVGAVRSQWKMDRGFLRNAFDAVKGSRVARAARSVDLYFFTHGRKVIRRLGKDGGGEKAANQISRMIPEYHAEWGNIAGPWVKKYIDILKENDISKKRQVSYRDPKTGEMKEVNEHHNMVFAKEGKQPPANARIAKAVQQVTQLFQEVKDVLAKENVATEIFEGGGRRYVPFAEQLDDPNYWPRKYDLDYEIKTTDPETGEEHVAKLRDLVGDKMGEATRERMIRGIMRDNGMSRAAVEDWLASRHRDTPLIGNVERARQYDLPYYRTDANAAIEYLEGAGETVARTKVFGQRRQKLDKLIESIPGGRERRGVREIMDSLLAGRYMEDDTRALMGVIADWSVTTKMGFSAVKVLGHSAWAPFSANTRAYLGGLFQGVFDYADARERAMISGAVLEQYKNTALKEFGARKGSLGSKFLDYVQFHRAYEFGRIVADSTARVYLERYALPKLQKGKSVDFYRRNLKDVYLLDDKAIDDAIAAGSWSEADLNRAGKALADKTMFTNDPTELPPAWRARSENEIADFTLSTVRAVTLLKGYSLKTGAMLRERLIDEARKGNFRPWVPFMLLTPALGEAIAQFNSLFHSGKKKEAEQQLGPGSVLWKIAEDIGHMTGMSTVEMLLEMIANPHSKGRMDVAQVAYEFMLGPAASDLVHTTIQLPYELTNAKSEAARWNAIKRWMRSTFPATKPVVPPPVRKGSTNAGEERRMSPVPTQ